MRPVLAMPIGPDQILEIADALWQGMFPEHEAPQPDPVGSATEVAAEVEIQGAWNGAVRFSCSRGASRLLAAAMFAASADEVSQGDVDDAIGELANIFGGAIKAIVPEPATLSLPRAVALDGPHGGSSEATELHLCWCGEPVAIAVRSLAAS